MSIIGVADVKVLSNPAAFTAPLEFTITFDCNRPGLQDDLEWKLVYVGSSESEKFDQELETVIVGPVAIGRNAFTLQAPAPQLDLIPIADVLGVTVLLLSGFYKEREFIRIGYYVNNDYTDQTAEGQQLAAARAAWAAAEAETMAMATPPSAAAKAAEVHTRPPVVVAHIMRNILVDKPRVTRFNIPWDQEEASSADVASITAAVATGMSSIENMDDIEEENEAEAESESDSESEEEEEDENEFAEMEAVTPIL